MRNLAEIEREILSLPAAERERLALAVWESLEADSSTTENLDPEGITLALQREAELESGSVKPLNHAEFLQRTGTPRNENRVSSSYRLRY